jgi:hypothetical protein
MAHRWQVICRHGTMLLVATVVGPNVRCTLMDVMHPDMPTKVMTEVIMGHRRTAVLPLLKRGRCHTRLDTRWWRRRM